MARRIAAVGLAPTPGYAHVAVAGRLVVTAGAVPLDADGTLVGPEDHAAQARQVLANLEAQLAAAGAAPADVLKTTVFVVGPRASLTEVWDVVQDSPFAPVASTLLGVTVLGYEGQLVEVEAIAALE